MDAFLEICKMYKKYKLQIVAMFFIAILIMIISVVLPILSQKLIDEGLYHQDVQKVIILVVQMSVVSLIYSFLSYLQSYIEIRVKGQMEFDLIKNAFSHALRLKTYYLKKYSLIKILNDVFYDIQQILNIAESSFLTIFVTAFKTIGACIALFYLNWKLALCVLSIVPVKIIVNGCLRKKTIIFSSKLKNINKDYNSWFEDVVNGALDIRIWNLYKQIEDECVDYQKQTIINDVKSNLLRKRYNEMTDCIESIVLYILYIIGATYILKSQLSIGQLLSFVTFSSYLLMPIDVFLHLQVVLTSIKPSINSYHEFVAYEEENIEAGIPMDDIIIEKIKFENVSLAFENNVILKDINFELNRGEKIAFIGENGSGKSSCVNLIERLIEPTSGKIYINDIDISDFNIINYRSNIRVVNQTIHLFNKSIRENVLLGHFNNEEINNKEKLFDFIEDLSQGWETNIGVGGNKLSGGEKQKIALARALHKHAKILILDEATSAYDKQSKEMFNDMFLEKNYGDISIFVTHDNTLLKNMDKIIKFKDGKIELVEGTGRIK